jgi:hypothetical protein
MNAAAGLCVLLRIGGRPFAARPRSAPWVQAGRGCRLTASVDLTAFERCDRRHRSAVRQRFIFWTTHWARPEGRERPGIGCGELSASGSRSGGGGCGAGGVYGGDGGPRLEGPRAAATSAASLDHLVGALVGGGGLLLAIAATLTPDPPRTNRPRSSIHR